MMESFIVKRVKDEPLSNIYTLKKKFMVICDRLSSSSLTWEECIKTYISVT